MRLMRIKKCVQLASRSWRPTFGFTLILNALDLIWHLCNFLAPAWVVAALMAGALKLLWRQDLRSRGWRQLWLWGGVGGSLALLAALVLLGRDGRLAGYGLMILAIALPQWALAWGQGLLGRR